jgi:hypothetical protein
MRAANQQDLIYKRGQAGITKASVTIVFNNSDREKSPVGLENCPQITVTRQVRRNIPYPSAPTPMLNDIPHRRLRFPMYLNTFSTATSRNRTRSRRSSRACSSISITRTFSSCKAASPRLDVFLPHASPSAHSSPAGTQYAPTRDSWHGGRGRWDTHV